MNIKTSNDIFTEISNKEVESSLGNKPFRWCFIEKEMRWNGNFSFKEYKKDLNRFIRDIETAIYDKFHDKLWKDVMQLFHSGVYKNLSSKQKEIIKDKIPNDEQVFHIHISQKHVLFGYRSDDFFHIVINDPDHKFNKLK